jgi:amidase
VGTETSGSLIAPAMAQGVVALKPTKGLVPGSGIIPLIANNDSAGPIARSVRDAAELLGFLKQH